MPRQNVFFIASKLNTLKKSKYLLKKSDKTKKFSRRFLGQASFEYFVLFMLLAFFCLLSVTKVFPYVSQTVEGVFQSAVRGIILD